MKAKTYAALQKTYDQSHLTCSTAAYYESLGNETEALRCWRECLTQLQSYSSMSAYRPRSDSEKALLRSLKTLKEQCENRAALMQAILMSRVEAENAGAGLMMDRPDFGAPLSPPVLPDRLPLPRPAMPPASVSAPAGQNVKPAGTPPHLIAPTPKSENPDRRTFLATLRPTNNRKTRRLSEFGGDVAGGPAAAAQAASMAWTAVSKNDGQQIAPSLNPDAPAARTASASTGDLPLRPEGRRPSISAYDREDSGSDTVPTPTVRRRPGVEGLKSRPQSSVLPLGSPTLAPFDDPPPPPPPPHRVPVQRVPSVRRKPVPSQEGERAGAPPQPPPKLPRRPTADSETQTRPRLRRNRSVSDGAPPVHSSGSSAVTSPVEPSQQYPYDSAYSSHEHSSPPSSPTPEDAFQARLSAALKSIPKSVDAAAASQVATEIVVKGDEVHWDDIAGLNAAKQALKEAVVYPFLRPDLFLGLREPARGMLLFGPPGTGKTMLARAVATESKSTFFSISASSLTSKYLGESEKLVRALFALAKALAPSIIFVDEIDSLLSSRGGGGGEHEATRRIKTEFLIQWSDLARAAAGRECSDPTVGDASRVLVLAATNLPWAIDEAARRRFVRRQYIPLPETETRKRQFENLVASQNHRLGEEEMDRLVELTDGFSGSDITALAKDAAMGPLRSLGEKLLFMKMEEIRPIEMRDFEKSLESIRPSVSQEGLRRFEEWAEKYGERVA